MPNVGTTYAVCILDRGISTLKLWGTPLKTLKSSGRTQSPLFLTFGFGSGSGDAGRVTCAEAVFAETSHLDQYEATSIFSAILRLVLKELSAFLFRAFQPKIDGSTYFTQDILERLVSSLGESDGGQIALFGAALSSGRRTRATGSGYPGLTARLSSKRTVCRTSTSPFFMYTSGRRCGSERACDRQEWRIPAYSLDSRQSLFWTAGIDDSRSIGRRKSDWNNLTVA
ncbi:hypothetical protein B0H16DRAFT_1457607 [Mycena metata]|uniref:Uncharacterized protein n=1 Tax=Mycena metata TaxID=1033252 RepID=A0AAD7J693_9AGAR|nr:hypothetical protein B0H16DRAFT_1457607 [Mycena metata]